MHTSRVLQLVLFPVRISEQKVPFAVVSDIFVSSVRGVIYYQAEEDKQLFALSPLKILIHFFLGSIVPFKWSDTSYQHKPTLASHQTLLSRFFCCYFLWSSAIVTIQAMFFFSFFKFTCQFLISKDTHLKFEIFLASFL